MLSGNTKDKASARVVYIKALEVPISGIVIDISTICRWSFLPFLLLNPLLINIEEIFT